MQLHLFQRIGADFCAARKHAFLADEMGLGKTPQLVRAAARAGANRALIIGPAILEGDWLRTFKGWAPERPPLHALRDPAKLPNAGDVFASYERATMHRDALRAGKFDVLICDEAKALKNPTSERCRAILNPIYSGKRSIASSCGAVWLADGTPLPNNPAELWPALKSAGLVEGRYWDFAYRFCRVDETPFGRRIQGAKNPEALRELLRGYMLRRTTAEVLPELPPLHIDAIEVDGIEPDGGNPILPQLRALDEAAHEAIALALEARDWQMRHVPHVGTLRRLTGLAKAYDAARLARMELDFLHPKIVLFGLHTEVLRYLARELHEFGVVLLTGHETNAQRRKSIERFQNDPVCRVAIGQIKAAGAGITLTAANRLIVVESAWTPADNEQVQKRIHRIGQFRECFVSYLSLRGSSDVRVTAATRAKSEAAHAILQDGLTV